MTTPFRPPCPNASAPKPVPIEKALEERVKELNCLYGITRLAHDTEQSESELLLATADLLCRSWQYPEITCACIILDGREFSSAGFQETRWTQSSRIRMGRKTVGRVQVSYLERRPEAAEGPFLQEERNLLDAAADLIGRIIGQRRTDHRLRAMSREIILAQENERQRIARELHDHLAQDLSLAKADLDDALLCPENISLKKLAGVRNTLGNAIFSIRNLAYHLIPPGLSELGLVASIHAYCEDFSSRHSIPVDVYADGMDNLELDFETQINLYRLVQEALTNIRKHSRAERAVVRMLGSWPDILVRIEDDGCGADLKDCFSTKAGKKRMGLWSMRERIRLLDGKVTFKTSPGKGMKILVEIPIRRMHCEQT